MQKPTVSSGFAGVENKGFEPLTSWLPAKIISLEAPINKGKLIFKVLKS